MSISSVTASIPVKPPEVESKPPEVKPPEDTRTAQPTVRAALPPGQGTRIDQFA